MNKQQVIDVMQNVGSSEDVACCAALLDFIEKSSKKVYYYADFVASVERLHLDEPIQYVQRCVNLFKSKRINLLRQEYRYADDDGVIYPVDVEDLQAAYADGRLFLEWRNCSDSDFASKVYIVFFTRDGDV